MLIRIGLVGSFMKFLHLSAGGALILLMGGSALAETVEWKIDQGFGDIGLSPSQLVIEAASYTPPPESGLAFALRRINTPGFENYSGATFVDQTAQVALDFTGLLALNIYYGTSADDWGSKSFHFENEGWFGKDTYSLGMDKIGHAYGAYLYSEYFTQRITHGSGNSEGAGITGALLGFGMQSVVEVLDGYSADYGFSNEDLIADGVGAGFSMLRSTIPGLAEKLDFRMEYNPWVSTGDSFSPFNDYSGQKYLLALKLGGFEQFQDSPLRFVELQAGYFARGYGAKGAPAIGELRREPYVAIGVNLAELFAVEPVRDTLPAQFARRAVEYIQLPYTYAATTQN
jgi:hypothetical protein